MPPKPLGAALQNPNFSPSPFGIGSRVTLVDRVVERIRLRIIDGDLLPGQHVHQQEFADMLEVSRTPLREAFRRLEAEGWLRLRAHHGAEVTALSFTEAEEIFSMRTLLETFAIRVSTLNHTDDDARVAWDMLEVRPREMTRDASSPTFDELNSQFHLLLYGFGRELLPRRLEQTISHLWARGMRYRQFYWSAGSAVERSLTDHRVIFEAWQRRDPVASERALGHHVLNALGTITSHLDGAVPSSPAIVELAKKYGVQLAKETTEDAQTRLIVNG